jgi:hypothetical protein
METAQDGKEKLRIIIEELGEKMKMLPPEFYKKFIEWKQMGRNLGLF